MVAISLTKFIDVLWLTAKNLSGQIPKDIRKFSGDLEVLRILVVSGFVHILRLIKSTVRIYGVENAMC